MFKRIKRKIITAGLAALLLGCSKDSGNISGPPPPPPPPPAQQNHNPVINSSCVAQGDENHAYTYQVSATDPDGDALIYSLPQAPSWLSINSATGLISGIMPEVSSDQQFSFQTAVSDGKGGSGSQSCNPTIKNLFNNYLLSSDQLNGLVVTDSTLAFLQPVNFAVGDIAASGITSQTPYGLFREITSISSDRRRVNTTHAALEEVVREVHLSYSQELSPSNILSFSGREGVSMIPAGSQDFKFGVSLTNVILYDRDGNRNTTYDQIIANGNISFNAGFGFDIVISPPFTLNRVSFQQTLGEVADITLGSNLFGFATLQEVPVAEYNLNPIVMGILPTFPPIPVIVVPKIQVNVGLNPSRVNPLAFRVRQDANLTARLTYDGSWSSSADFRNSFDFFIPNPSGEWDITAYAGPRLNLSLFGVAGPFAAASTFLKLQSPADGNWKLYGGFNASLGVSMEILSRRIAAYSKKVLEREILLAERGSTPTTRILFNTTRDGNSEGYSMNPDGSDQRNLTNHSSHDYDVSASPDSRWFVFVSERDGNPEVYRQNFDGSNLRRLTSTTGSSNSNERYPDISPDGSRIVFYSTRNANEELFLMNASDGGNVTKIPISFGVHGQPRWCGQNRIVFTSNLFGGGSNFDVYTINTDGTGIQRLTSHSSMDVEPFCSPDGTRIAYASNQTGTFNIYVMNADSSGKINISNIQGIAQQHPAWSRDNRIVYSHGTGTSSEIWVMNADGTNKTRLTNNSYFDGNPSWSPR